MFNEEENRNLADSENTPAQSEGAAGAEDKAGAEKNAFYEPWQQPVGSEGGASGTGGYSPGLHSGAFGSYQRNAQTEPKAEKKKSGAWMRFARVLCLVLACALAGGGAAYGVVRYSLSSGLLKPQVVLGSDSAKGGETAGQKDDSGSATPQSSPAPADTLASTGRELTGEEIYNLAIKQVVGVNTEVTTTNVFGQRTSSAVSGSGFIISPDGYIVTNYHVIAYADRLGSTLTVMLHDGSSYPAKIVGYEQDNDIAVIKIDATGLEPVTIGNNDTMKVGDRVYAVGNPLGELTYTMTSGIVSALGRVIQVDETTSINMFQIDAAVNAGNSGGPVYNSRGEVIGIVSAKYASAGVEGLGFAIPINDAIDIVQQLISHGFVSGKPSLGVSVRTMTKAAAQYYNVVEGAYVEAVKPGSAADKAGIKPGDIITKLGDTPVTSTDTLKLAKKKFKAGDTTTVVVYRDGKSVTLTITFDEEGVTATSSVTQPQGRQAG